ncbi:hypothetical protein C8R43DRAFT_946860 [Mycena crocata]|nr:hypothetical protein C8R43DRAFT_946860 [Mycena crocata]
MATHRQTSRSKTAKKAAAAGPAPEALQQLLDHRALLCGRVRQAGRPDMLQPRPQKSHRNPQLLRSQANRAVSSSKEVKKAPKPKVLVPSVTVLLTDIFQRQSTAQSTDKATLIAHAMSLAEMAEIDPSLVDFFADVASFTEHDNILDIFQVDHICFPVLDEELRCSEVPSPVDLPFQRLLAPLAFVFLLPLFTHPEWVISIDPVQLPFLLHFTVPVFELLIKMLKRISDSPQYLSLMKNTKELIKNAAALPTSWMPIRDFLKKKDFRDVQPLSSAFKVYGKFSRLEGIVDDHFPVFCPSWFITPFTFERDDWNMFSILDDAVVRQLVPHFMLDISDDMLPTLASDLTRALPRLLAFSGMVALRAMSDLSRQFFWEINRLIECFPASFPARNLDWDRVLPSNKSLLGEDCLPTNFLLPSGDWAPPPGRPIGFYPLIKGMFNLKLEKEVLKHQKSQWVDYYNPYPKDCWERTQKNTTVVTAVNTTLVPASSRASSRSPSPEVEEPVTPSKGKGKAKVIPSSPPGEKWFGNQSLNTPMAGGFDKAGPPLGGKSHSKCPRPWPEPLTVDPTDISPPIASFNEPSPSVIDLDEGQAGASSQPERRVLGRAKRQPPEFAKGEGAPPPKCSRPTVDVRPNPRTKSKVATTSRPSGKKAAVTIPHALSASPTGTIHTSCLTPVVKNQGGCPRRMNYKPLEADEKFSLEKLVMALDRFDSTCVYKCTNCLKTGLRCHKHEIAGQPCEECKDKSRCSHLHLPGKMVGGFPEWLVDNVRQINSVALMYRHSLGNLEFMHRTLESEDSRLLNAVQNLPNVYKGWWQAYYGFAANLNDTVHHLGQGHLEAFVDIQGESHAEAREVIKGVVKRALNLVEEKPELPEAAYKGFAPLICEGALSVRDLKAEAGDEESSEHSGDNYWNAPSAKTLSAMVPKLVGLLAVILLMRGALPLPWNIFVPCPSTPLATAAPLLALSVTPLCGASLALLAYWLTWLFGTNAVIAIMHFEASATREERALRAEDTGNRWKAGVSMYSTYFASSGRSGQGAITNTSANWSDPDLLMKLGPHSLPPMSPEPQSQKQKITAQLARRKDKLCTLRHREAQRKYRERYRAEVKESEARKKMAAELRREPDTDYRERAHPDSGKIYLRKILAKFGEKLFNEVYTPLYRLHGNQTFKFKIEWDQEGESEEERERVREDGAEGQRDTPASFQKINYRGHPSSCFRRFGYSDTAEINVIISSVCVVLYLWALVVYIKSIVDTAVLVRVPATSNTKARWQTSGSPLNNFSNILKG